MTNTNEDILQEKFFADKTRQNLEHIRDSLQQNANSPEAKQLLDSLVKINTSNMKADFQSTFTLPFGIQLKMNTNTDSVSIFIDHDTLYIKDADFVNMPADSLAKKYFPKKKWWGKILLKQAQKSILHSGDFLRYLFNQGLIALLIVIPSISLWLKLLYRRQKRYYVEHLIFSVNVHSFFLIALLIYYSLSLLFEWNSRNIFYGILLLYIGRSFYLFYEQSFFKSLFKMLLSLIVYLFLLTFALYATAAISVLLF